MDQRTPEGEQEAAQAGGQRRWAGQLGRGQGLARILSVQLFCSSGSLGSGSLHTQRMLSSPATRLDRMAGTARGSSDSWAGGWELAPSHKLSVLPRPAASFRLGIQELVASPAGAWGRVKAWDFFFFNYEYVLNAKEGSP